MQNIDHAASVPACIAAKLMKKSTDFIRWGLRKERLPFGCAVQTPGKTDRWSYYISPKLLSDFIGVDVDTILTMTEEYKAGRRTP